MDVIRILWFILETLLLTSTAYGGSKPTNINEYVHKLIHNLYDKIRDMIPDDVPVRLRNLEIFLSNSSVPTYLSWFSLGTFSNLGNSFQRAGECFIRERESEFKVTCKVKFMDLQATLPKINKDRYELLINASGHLILSVPKDKRNVTVALMTLFNVNFTMQAWDSTTLAQTSTPSTYNLDEDSPTHFKDTYRLVFQKFVTEGKFKSALDSTLASFPKINLKVIRKPATGKRRRAKK
uniref:Putative secreted protein n=1 Tax=Ixodes ricinus TaxID=34613 RepID=A0A6B0V4V8_IXORI